jgi:ABC-type antimicrobial peptide transport system permease subunit
MAFTVARQRREIGIRSALGARSTRLLAGILGRAASQVGIGAAAGVLLALWLGAYLPVERVGGAPVPGLIPVAALVMAVVGLLAAAGPALRALRLEPTEVLRDN